MDSVIDFLEERGFVDALSSPDLKTLCNNPLKVYCGFDPSADSLHLGNLIGILALAHFQRFGHTPVVVLGGTTGRIGDPSGKDKERPLLNAETIAQNVASIRKQFEAILDFSGTYPEPLIVNNDDWYSKMPLIDFLRDVGKHFRIGAMLAKESVKTRVQSEEGMSFTEFSYQLIQGYDFYHLYQEEGVTLQIGGSDQWGNITAGIDYVRRMCQKTVFGLTWPLLTRSDGKKFGKSEEGAIWLSADKCSPYQFYQYFMRIPDPDIPRMCKMLTFLSTEEIREIEQQMKGLDYVPNSAQRLLAEEVTRIVHGEEGLAVAQKVTQAAAPGGEAKLDSAALEEIASDMPSIFLAKSDVVGYRFPDLAVKTGLLSSKGEAIRLIKNGGAYLNNQKLLDASKEIQETDLIDNKYLLLGSGKKKKILVSVS